MVELFVFSNKDENLWKRLTTRLLITALGRKGTSRGGAGGHLAGTYESRSFLMSRYDPFPGSSKWLPLSFL